MKKIDQEGLVDNEIDEELVKKAKEQEARLKREQAEEEAKLYADICRRYHVPGWISLDKRLVDEYIQLRTNCWILCTFGRLLYEKHCPDGGCEYKSKVLDAGLTAGEYWQLQEDDDFGMRPPEEDEKQKENK